MNAVTFIRDHTTHDNDHPHQDECPICLDDYTNEQCLRITKVPECSHHIGSKCLDDMLRSQSHEEKRCPLCRAIWVPARPLPVPPHAQSPSASQRMAGMFAGLDGIGADIANQQLGTRRGFADDDDTLPPQLQQVRRIRRELPNPASHHVPRAPMAEQQRTPIVTDSDSDDADYDTHVQNFEDFRREIADIRSRAPHGHMSRMSRRRRVTDKNGNNRNGNGGASKCHNASSNSDNATDTPGTGVFNRLLNNRRTLNPFRPATENNVATPPALTDDPLGQHERVMDGCANRHRQADERRASNQQLDHREGDLSPREQAIITMRQMTLARREVELIARETRVDELMRVARRHWEEAEELVRRHREEMDELLN